MSNASTKKFDIGRFDFLGNAKYIVPIWFLIALGGMVAIGIHGLNYGIDFAGGTEIQLQFAKPEDSNQLRNLLSEVGYKDAGVQSIGDKNEFLIRLHSAQGKDEKETNDLQNAMVGKVIAQVKSVVKDNPVEVRKVDTVGPQVGEELKHNSILATFYSLLMILIYIGIRFDYKYAPGAVICLIHDTILMVSIYAIFDKEVNVQTMAAILTLIGYSLNDTIITFDRIRENEKLFRGESFYNIVNRSINDMLSRTILTHVTTELAVIALYILCDGVIKEIAFTLTVGIILATYSSIYIASPLVILIDGYEHRREQSRLRAAKA